MPPPHFTPTSAGAAGAAPAQVDVPKSIRAALKELSVRLRAALVSDEQTSATALPLALSAIQSLLNDPNLPPAPTSTGSSSSGGGGGGSSGSSSAAAVAAANISTASTSGANNTNAQAVAATKAQLRAHLASKVNAELLDIYNDDMDQEDLKSTSSLVEILQRLSPLLGPACIVLEWWDLVLRPLLKNHLTSTQCASRARDLVVFAMAATPSASYVDEPEPTAAWPPREGLDAARKRGDAPYPTSSTDPNEGSVAAAIERRGPSRERRSASGAAAKSHSADHLRRFTQRIFDLYTSEASATAIGQRNDDEDEAKDEQEAKAQTLAAPETENVGIVDSAATKVQPWSGDLDAAPLIDVVGTTWKGNLETILIAFGSLRPKELFHHLAESFDDPLARVPILLLLSIFLRLYSMHAPLITRTALPRMLVLSAQLDTSTTSTALCITALVMLLPHIANWIANGGAGGLPTFLAIYARVIDWRKLGVGWENRTGSDDGMEELRRQYDEEFAEVDRLGKRLLARPDLNWRRLESSFDTVASSPPNAVQFFTFLYGIFPCNMIRFLRAPIDYLRKAQYDSPVAGSWEDMMDELAVQSRSAPVLRAHTLHPALVSLSAEKEVSDTQRWLQHEPADITAECISLHLGARHEGHAATSERHPLGQLQFTSTGTATPAASRFQSSRGSEHAGTPNSKQLHTLVGDPSGSLAQSIAHRRGSTHSSGGGHHEFSFESTPDSRMLTEYAALRWAAPLTSTGALRPFAFDSPTGLLALSPARSSTLATSGLLSRMHLGGSPQTNAKSRLGISVPQDPISSPPSPLTQVVRLRRERSASHSSATSVPPSLEGGSLGEALGTERMKSPTSATASPLLQAARPARSEVYNELAYAQRENLLLRNELNFELYLKEQHLIHIGRLQSDRIADTALEAERQNLYHTVRSLRSRISATMAAQEKQRMEAASTKSRHAAWESELNAKLRTYREERKVWTNESRELRAALEDARATSQSQARQLEEDAKELFELRQQVEADRKKVKQIAEYEVKIRQLSSMLSMWDEDVRRYDQQRREMELLLSRWHEMEMMLQASDDDAGNLRSLSESQAARIETLDRDLSLVRSDAIRLRSSQHQVTSASPLRPTPTRGNATREAALEAEKTRMQSQIETLEAQALDLRVRAESAEATLALKLKASPTTSKDLEQLNPELHDAATSSSHAGDTWIQDALHAQIPLLSLGASHSQDAVTPSGLTAADLSTRAEDASKGGSVAGKADL
ncbi:hypothetical protein IE81DRAFT_330971 [Ceraceosorus guamensis]|uniref:Hamartin-domain-containing protein n=1 Tax=Ceraceosorus guamensis TaxID=1522189 RepID=A0A316VV97_9BASI|nr:hypothetical protein IE81DRAFT_330971 [Ceraceosorus guamensis]PWN41362.1 hypothetical protein IE81DRAFT_330971 [Ceraceosorus guamensis]